MSNPYTLSPATPADAPRIATIYSKSWVSPFTQLQFGHVTPTALASIMAPRVAQQMTEPYTQWMVMRYTSPEGEEEVAAVATWNIPHDEEPDHDAESAEDREERVKFEDELYRKSLPETSNKDLVMEFTVGLRDLRKDVLRGRRHFGKLSVVLLPLSECLFRPPALDNIATHPDHRGQGLASQLISWGTSQADAQNVVVYLDTASENPAKGLYTKLGFQEQSNRSVIEDLSKFGGEGSHTHVAFVRDPKNSA